MNTYEYRLKQIQMIKNEAENSLKENEKHLTREVIQQRKLFIKKLSDEEQGLLKELGVTKEAKPVTEEKQEDKDKAKKQKNKTRKDDKK